VGFRRLQPPVTLDNGAARRRGRTALGLAAAPPQRDRPRVAALRTAAAAALAALAASLLIAAPAGAASRKALQSAAFAVPTPTAPIRDLVIIRPSRAEARAAATASAVRYPVNDGAGRTVAITSDCLPLTCNSADPPTIANFLGTLPHGDEMNLLTVNLVPAIEISAQCGSVEAQACYYPGENRMGINGDDTPASDGASRAYVIAHEYGHHLANHRNNSPFDDPAIDWGPKNWASFAGVCQGVRAGRYFPGDEGDHYYDNPGEAFAESFAHNAFPTQPVPWEWPDFPDPSIGAYPAIQRDALQPWNGDSVDKRRGHFPKRRRPRKILKKFGTPLDGDLKLSLSGPDRADLALKLLDSTGHVLARSDGVGSQESVSYQICGERGVTAVVRRHGRRLTRFKLTALIP